MSTIIDVAKHAGVSPMTVSRFLNRPELLRPATRSRVAEAIHLLRFVPNESARALIRRRTNTVALVLADITNPYFTTIARGVEDAATALGLTTILGNTDERLEKQARYIETLVARRVDGVILSPILGSEPHLESLAARGIPVLLVDRRVAGSTADVLLSDSRDGGRQLAQHLVSHGHTDVLFIGGPAAVSSLEERLAGVCEGLAVHGLAPEVHLGRYDQRSGEQIVDALAQRGRLDRGTRRGRRPSGADRANNLVALGALTASGAIGCAFRRTWRSPGSAIWSRQPSSTRFSP
jgi:LacI family transcriptional regulator